MPSSAPCSSCRKLYGRGQTVRLTQFWFAQKYLNGLLDWRIGRTSMGEDFAQFACDFQNLTFCGSPPGNIVGGYIYKWPISQWGTRLKVALGDSAYVEAGVYDQNQEYIGFADKLLPVFYPGSTGVLIPAELGWLPTLGGGSLPGSYKVGGWYSTSTANDIVLDTNSNPVGPTRLPPLQRRGLYGAYINFEQQVTRTTTDNPKGGLRLFLNATPADSATSVTDRQIAAGMVYTGPLEARPDDSIAFAMGTTHVNDGVAYTQAVQYSLGLGRWPFRTQNMPSNCIILSSRFPDCSFVRISSTCTLHKATARTRTSSCSD